MEEANTPTQQTGPHAGVLRGQDGLHQEGATVERDIPGQLVAGPSGVGEHVGLPAPQVPQVAAICICSGTVLAHRQDLF